MRSRSRCEGIQDSSLQVKEETSGSTIPWHNDTGDITGDIPSKVIMVKTAHHFGLDVRDLLANRREHSDKRMLAIVLAHNLSLESTVALGRTFQRDHTTIMYNLKKGKELVNSSQMREHYHKIVDSILQDYYALRRQGWVA